MNKPLYVSFYTPQYAEEAKGLIESLDQFGLEHKVTAVEDLGSWEKNTSYKAAFVRDCIPFYAVRPIVWLDADARVKQMPELFEKLADEKVDFAAHWKDGWELVSSTLFFGATNNALALASIWADEAAEHPEEWDQRSLQRIIETHEWAKQLRVERLPPAYTAIFDAAMVPPGQEVIQQRQYSRIVKGIAPASSLPQ